jgi:Raf kinase inhibitor-like YbhB/YbcL family protein
MELSTPAFDEGEMIPPRYTCDGVDVNPELNITGVPADAETLVLLVDDPDIPEFAAEKIGKPVWDHWVLFNIDPEIDTIEEDNAPPDTVEGVNSTGEVGYQGPCPPDGEHRYFFKLYALDTAINLGQGCTKQDVEHAMNSHILEETELVGRYNRPKNR